MKRIEQKLKKLTYVMAGPLNLQVVLTNILLNYRYKISQFFLRFVFLKCRNDSVILQIL